MNRQPLHIVKIGGRIADDDALLEDFLVAFSEMPNPKILVHGGGSQATQMSQRLGIETIMKDGRRITDDATLEIAIMVYAGLINKKLVALLQAMEMNAAGLTGADMNLIRARKRPPGQIDFGWVGDIVSVNDKALDDLLEQKYVPVIAPITHDGSGQLLNTNADTIASALASQLAQQSEVILMYCFEHKGVLKDVKSSLGETFSRIRQHDLSDMIEGGQIHSGMLPKINNAIEASRQGVSNVFICGVHNLNCLTDATKIEWNEIAN